MRILFEFVLEVKWVALGWHNLISSEPLGANVFGQHNPVENRLISCWPIQTK